MHTIRALAILSLLLVAGPALAQSRLGDFKPFNSWWIHPTQGTLGIAWDTQAIRIDVDGDGSTESSFLRPIGSTGIPDAAISSLRLTPSRTIVYAFGGSCNAGAGTLVYFYRRPSFGNRLEPIRTGLCIPRGIDRLGFYDTGLCDEPNGQGLGLACDGRLGVSPQRIAYFATASSTFGNENFVWVDLTTGNTSFAPSFDFSNGLGFVHVSPSGTQGFVQHDLSVVGETDYKLIDLCPGSLGEVINPGGAPIANIAGNVGATVTAASAGNVSIAVGRPTELPITTYNLADCLTETGACCTDFGCGGQGYTPAVCQSFGTYAGPGSTCSDCPEPPVIEACCFETGDPICQQFSNAECTAQGGDPQVGVSFCNFDTCPMPDPTTTLDGPTTAGVGDSVTYTFDYENEGGVTAPAVQIEIQLPYGAEFEGATNGGDYDGATLRWMLGNLAPGAGGSVSFTFSLGCLAAESQAYMQGLISYEVSLDGARVYDPSDAVLLDIGSASSGPLTVSLASTPDREPLLPGDEVEHAITLTNANAQAITGVQIGRANSSVPLGLVYGNAASFARVIDAAGGTVDTSSGFEWRGDVPAGASRTIRFATSIDACVPAGVDETSLDFGTEVAAFDQCNTVIGQSAEPEAFALEHLVEVTIGATNLAPPQKLRAPIIDVDVQVARPGATANVAVSIGSGAGQAVSGVSLSAILRGINVTSPPTEPGASYDATTRVLSWTGNVPASGAATIHFTGTLTACRGEINLDGSTGPGCTDIKANSLIAAVPVPPSGPWLAAVGHRGHPFNPGSIEDHLVRVDPGPPVQTTTMLCLPLEYSTGIGAGPDGTVWAGFLPTYRINPRTLDFAPFDLDRFFDVGMNSLDDVAVDPVDGTVYFAGYSYSTTSSARIMRYDQAQDLLTPFYDDSSYSSIGSMVVDHQGSLAAIARVGAQNMLVRIDPGAPADEVVLYDPPSSLLTDVAIDRDGSYLVIDGYFFTTPTLYDVDRDSGDRTTLIPNLTTLFPATQAWGQVEVDAGGDLFLAPAQPGLGRVRRATLDVGEVIHPFTFGAGDLGDLAMVSLPAPEPGAVALACASLGALAWLVRRRVR